jgi:hypothetical protein
MNLFENGPRTGTGNTKNKPKTWIRTGKMGPGPGPRPVPGPAPGPGQDQDRDRDQDQDRDPRKTEPDLT